MPAGNITDVERVKRLHTIKDLQEQGLKDNQIADKLGMSYMAVRRACLYLKELERADLTQEDLAKKRSELYLKLTEAEAEVKRLFDLYKDPIICPLCNGTGKKVEEEAEDKLCKKCGGLGYIHDSLNANRFHAEWLSTIEKMMKLYGLDMIKPEVIINNQYTSQTNNLIEKVDAGTANKLRSIIIGTHEQKLRTKYEEEYDQETI